jgi:hypothetical protein
MKHTKRAINHNGIPSKNYMRLMVAYYLKSLDMDTTRVNHKAIVFSESYLDPDKSTGILWKADKSMEPLIGFHQYLTEHGIKVKQYKYWGRVHSIWIHCANDHF